MDFSLAIVALALLAVAAISRLLSGTPVTAAMVFVAGGLLVGPELLGGVELEETSSTVRALAEATLAIVLFSDASRIDLRQLRPQVGVPVRLLGIGLPLTIIAGTLLAAVVFESMSFGEALILGVILAPTDAALGQAVVTERSVPARVRQGLNVESGLNDGICVPLLFAAVAAADIESGIAEGRSAATLLAEEIGFGILAGLVAGALAAALLLWASRRGLITGGWRQVVPLAAAALAYGLADPFGGSGFIAAFVGGMAFRAVLRRDPEDVGRLSEEAGDILSGVTFLLFGAILLEPALGAVSLEIALYALASLTLVRMLPVAIAMLGSHARAPTVAFLGWFGPRGLASIVFALIVLEESNLPAQETILTVVYLTVGLSVLAHGLTAAPLAGRYARWWERHPRREPGLEGAPADPGRPRGAFAPRASDAAQ
ncbi:sodium:proton antiporter [Thermoleophilia bacterium SCSIO 60948]|nr:sodium:proton antiporter [Thermoleophilia bacterium SCSIO 60948]